ncbi:Uncharacterised protein [Lelliottia amnigena]|nr:hypothetical protein CCAJJPOJ_02561 [Lelliottia sp. T2.26D-8]VDZ90401.1 Uncharacterised protein [Lelliottia amnigena]
MGAKAIINDIWQDSLLLHIRVIGCKHWLF